MKRNLIILSLVIIAGCENRTGTSNQSDSAIVTTPTKPVDIKPVEDNIPQISGCYMEVLKRDTFVASLQQNGNLISGKLSFDNYEKDGSTGTVKGRFEGNVLKLYYSFASEGMNSVMEVWFKEKDGALIRGTGDMNTRGDTAYFVNPASIKYDGSSLKKTGCENLPAKYK